MKQVEKYLLKVALLLGIFIMPFAASAEEIDMKEKAKMLDIPLSKLEEHCVVSHFTAEKMAEGARVKTDSDYGIALTGVAGPDALEGHQAGTVFIGIADRNQVRSIKVVIGGRSRSDVRYISTLYAFNLVRQALLQEDNSI